MTSSDGFCSTLTFASGELGQIYTGEVPTAKHPTLCTTAVSSSQNTPMATPTSIAPPSPFPTSNSGSHHRTSSYPIAPSPPPAPVVRQSSPTRSNSTSSVATVASYANPAAAAAAAASGTGVVISNPPLVSGSLPGIAQTPGTGTGLSFMTGMPMTTPPQTPRSATSSVSGVKRDASESEKEDGAVGGEKKRRRIAPTLVPEQSQGSSSGQ
jgi:chromatin assembly factor 1 subunit B